MAYFDVYELRNRQEKLESTNRLVFTEGTYVMVRLDGRAFSTLSRKHLTRPFDANFKSAMIAAASHLLKEFRPLFVYTQSDEITLAFPQDWCEFGRRKEKLVSLLSASASVAFFRGISVTNPQAADTIPIFDCRSWEVVSTVDVAGNVLLRQLDCIRNSISMWARHSPSYSPSNGKTQYEMLETLKYHHTPWESIDEHYRFGSLITNVDIVLPVGDERLKDIPEQYRPTTPVIRRRQVIESTEFPKDCKMVVELLMDK